MAPGMHSLQRQGCVSQPEAGIVRKKPLLSSNLRIKQIFVSRASGQQWLRQAQTLHKQLYCTHQRLCAVKDSEYDVFDEEDSSDEESQASIPERKPMQAMAMPKKKKGSTQQQATNNGAARSVASPADRSKERPAAKGEVKAATYTGIGGYDARVKAAGAGVHGGVLRYEETDKGRQSASKMEASKKREEKISAMLDKQEEKFDRAGLPEYPMGDRQEDSKANQGKKQTKAELQDAEDRLVAQFVPNFEWHTFRRAANELEDRLAPAVMMEDEEAKAALQQLYKKSKTAELVKSGLILADLRATPSGTLYGDTIWRFSQTPHTAARATTSPAAATPEAGKASASAGRRQGSAQTAGAVPSKSPQAGSSRRSGIKTQQGDLTPELPYNRFKAGEGVLVSHQAAQEEPTSYAGTLLEVRKTYVTIVLDPGKSVMLEAFIKDYGKVPKFRLDKQALETTTERQLKALEKMPSLHSLKQALRFGLERRHMDDVRDQYVAELSVKMILLGHGSSRVLEQYALQQPVWATGGSRRVEGERWRQAAGKLVRSVPNLNRSQKEAVAKAIFRRVTLWQGPPGTGKTRTLLAFMEVMVRTPSMLHSFTPILACADTNAAVDNIVDGLVQRRINVVRLGQPAKVRADLRHVCLDALTERTVDGKRAVKLRKEAERLVERYEKGGELWEKLTPADLQHLKNEASEKQKLARKLIRDASAYILQSCQVVASTCAGAGDESRLHNQLFRLVIIDEATQATEPSTLIPLMRGAESVVMAGDPCQLPPTVISRGAEEGGLQVTLFDRLCRLGVQPLLLDTQYRMHPLIAQIPSRLFYAGRLQSGVTPTERPLPTGFPWPNPVCPVALVPCDFGKESTGQASRTTLMGGGTSAAGDAAQAGASFKNEIEADLAIRALQMLLRGGDIQSAAVLTPYNGQVRELQRRLYGNKGLAAYEGMVDISSVDGYQGREADVIVISTVRCNRQGKLGFVTDPRRLNVAISRPRRGLVVIGSPQTLWADNNWQEWLIWVRDNKAVLHSDVVKET